MLEARSAKRIVMPVTSPNCWNGTNGLNNNTAKANAAR